MPTPFESATLNLKLFELRREPLLREARAWFLHEFTPLDFEELAELAGGERNRDFRMVISYWEMASSLVTTGAIDPAAFLAANGEMVASFAKIYPFLAELREVFREPGFGKHMEAVILDMPDGVATMMKRREKIRAGADARKAAETPGT